MKVKKLPSGYSYMMVGDKEYITSDGMSTIK